MSDTQEGFLSSPQRSNNSSRCTLSCLCVGLVISLTISITLVTIVTVCFVLKPGLSEPVMIKEMSHNGTVCFTCDYLGSGVESSDTLYQLVKTSRNTFCCLKENNELSEVFRLMVDRGLEGKGGNEMSSVLPLPKRLSVGAHLYLDTHRLEEGELHWSNEYSNDLAYKTGVTYKSGFLQVTSSGRYLIYSHIAYKQVREKADQDSFLHRITRQHPRQPNLGEITLLYSRNSYSNDGLPGSSFLSAVLVMRSNDQLRVRVSKPMSVLSKPFVSYFGILKI